MDKLELYDLIAGGEDSFTEFKRNLTQRTDFADEMIALANTEGGRILVGVDDDASIPGVAGERQVEESIVNIARNNCKPALNIAIDRVEADGQIVLVVTVPRRAGPPYEDNSGRCYIRVGSSKRLATPEERARLLQAAGLLHFDETPVFRQYPRPVLREAIVNAVAHRDYSLAGAQTLLYIFDNSLEIRSPGTLPNSVTLDNIRAHYSKARNELIARVLFNLGYVNTLGSGIPRIIRLMKQQGNPPPDFEVGSSQFLLRLWG